MVRVGLLHGNDLAAFLEAVFLLNAVILAEHITALAKASKPS